MKSPKSISATAKSSPSTEAPISPSSLDPTNLQKVLEATRWQSTPPGDAQDPHGQRGAGPSGWMWTSPSALCRLKMHLRGPGSTSASHNTKNTPEGKAAALTAVMCKPAQGPEHPKRALIQHARAAAAAAGVILTPGRWLCHQEAAGVHKWQLLTDV